MSVAVLIPTYRRNDALAEAVSSVLAQTRLPDEIVVVDNDPEGGAAETVANLAKGASTKLVYVHEPKPGVSNARNAGFATTAARFIAQLDDDETAHDNWLDALLKAHERLQTPVIFGPVIAQISGAISGPVRRAYLARIYSRLGPSEDKIIEEPFGCGNALLDRAALDLPNPVFDPAANELGGEDDLLFEALANRGARFGWAAEARVNEHVQVSRQSWRKLLERSFAHGQSPSQSCASAHPSSWPRVAFWMTVGLAQLVVYGLSAPLARLVSATAAAKCLDRAAQGAGKILWFDRVAPRLYGAGAT